MQYTHSEVSLQLSIIKDAYRHIEVKVCQGDTGAILTCIISHVTLDFYDNLGYTAPYWQILDWRQNHIQIPFNEIWNVIAVIDDFLYREIK